MNEEQDSLCVCRSPDTPGVVHRQDGPCHLEDDFPLPPKACDLDRPEGCESCQ